MARILDFILMINWAYSLVNLRLFKVSATADGQNKDKQKQDKQKQDNSTNPQIEATSKRVFDLLVAQRKIVFSESKIELITLSGASFNYQLDNFLVEKYAAHHQLSGEFSSLNTELSDTANITFVAEVNQKSLNDEEHTNIYLEADDIALSQLPRIGKLFNEGENIKEGKFEDETGELRSLQKSTTGQLQVWGRWQNRHWQKVDARLAIESDKNLTSYFTWVNDDYHHGYAVLHDISISDEEKQPPQIVSPIYVTYLHEIREQIDWNLFANDIKIRPLIEFASAIFSSDINPVQWLDSNEFSMQINSFNINLRKLNNEWKAPLGHLSIDKVNLGSQKKYSSSFRFRWLDIL